MPDRPLSTPPARSLPTRASSRWVPLLIFGVSLVLTVGAYLHLLQESRLAQQTRLAHEAALVVKEIRERLHDHAQHLYALRAFIAVHGTPSAADWHAYASRLDIGQNLTGTPTYGFAPYVAAEDIGRHTERARITDPDFEIRPVPPTDFVLPVRHIYPDTPENRLLRGYNIHAALQLAEAVEIARDHNDLAVSRSIGSMREAGRKEEVPGFLMILPVYRPGAETDSVDKRRAGFAGVVYVAYGMRDFMDTLAHRGAGLRIFAEEPVQDGGGAPTSPVLFDNGAYSPHAAIVEAREMQFGTHGWHLRLSPAPASGFDPAAMFPPVALAGGLLVSLLLGLLSHAQSRSREQAVALAEEITRELRLSEERFQLALAGTEDGIWDRDLRRGTVWLSPRLRAILGFPDNMATTDVTRFMDHVHPEDRAALSETIERHFMDRQPYVAEYRFRCGDGRQIWLSSRGQAVWNGEERPTRMVGAITDISGRKQAEARVAYYRTYFATVIKFMPHPVFVKDRERRFITVSRSFCELVGLDEQEIIGRIEMEGAALPVDVARIIAEMDEKALAGAGDQVAECTLPLAAGARRVLIRKTLVADPDGEPLIVGTLTDLTDLRAAERERAEADLQRQVILDAATEVSIIATDERGTIRLFNRGAEKMLGYRAEEMLDRCTPARFHLPEEMEERERFLSAELGQPVAGFDVFVTIPRLFGSECREWTYVRKDGSHLPVSLVVTTVRDESGKISGYLGVATDISDRKAAEAEIRRHRDHLQELVNERTADLVLAKESAERANEAKSEFLANISHELRTPLHSILSFASLGSERAGGAGQDKLLHYFARIQQSGGRLLALVNDLLELSKFEAGKMHVEPALQDVLPSIREVTSEVEALAAERRIRIEIAACCADTVAAIDGARFPQVMRNVLSNAIKYSPPDSVIRIILADSRLSRGRRATDAPEIPALEVEVRDEGIGIPENEIDRIFDKFVQSSRTNTGAGGTGLGLAISREIVLAHRGSIRACNNPGGGASFFVAVPRAVLPGH